MKKSVRFDFGSGYMDSTVMKTNSKVSILLLEVHTSILGEVRNIEIPGPTQQLLCSKYHDFLAIFALAHSKINQIA